MKQLSKINSIVTLTKIATMSLFFAATAASAQDGWTPECLWPGDWDQAYVPCISAIDYGNGNVNPGWTGGNNNSNSSNSCYAYNRDGRTCSFVGYSEGQVGQPWGQGSGQFRCTNGCLQYVGQ